MATERMIAPIVHQHLERIEDQIVVDAIASKMGKYHDEKGPIYDHETGSSDHHAMRCIAEACAEVYEVGMDHEEVWRVAQERCVATAMRLGGNFMLQTEEQDTGKDDICETIFRNASAALYMFALDYQMDNLVSIREAAYIGTPGDRLLATDAPCIVRDIVASEVRYMRKHGMAVDDGVHDTASVADIVAGRPRELRHEMWRANMEKAYDEIADEDDTYAEYKQRAAINHTRMALETLAFETDSEALREPCERTLAFVDTYFGDNNRMAAAVLHSIPDTYVTSLYGQNGVAAQQFERVLQHANESGGDIEGHALWKLHRYLPGGLVGEAAKQHRVIQQLREHYRSDAAFLAAALPEMPPIHHPEATAEFNQHMREMMTSICESLFPDPQFAQRYAEDMARSFEPRLWVQEASIGYVAYENNNNYKTMQVIMNRLLRTVDTYGPERFMEIANKFDLGAIDVLSVRDIEVLDALERGDESIIATMRQQDVTLVMFDAYGDHNGAMQNIADQLNIRDRNHERILMPWRRLPDFHETLAMLRRYGIKPCTIAIANHGEPGVMAFNKGPESFQIISDMSVARSLPGIQHPYDMNYSQLATITRHFMSEPRHPSPRRQPQKRWILASCASDSAPEDDIPSVAEKGIRMINQSNVSVIATEDYAELSGNETGKGLLMKGNRAGQHNRRPITSNMVELSIDPSVEWIQPVRTHVDERITT